MTFQESVEARVEQLQAELKRTKKLLKEASQILNEIKGGQNGNQKR